MPLFVYAPCRRSSGESQGAAEKSDSRRNSNLIQLRFKAVRCSSKEGRGLLWHCPIGTHKRDRRNKVGLSAYRGPTLCLHDDDLAGKLPLKQTTALHTTCRYNAEQRRYSQRTPLFGIRYPDFGFPSAGILIWGGRSSPLFTVRLLCNESR
jgi:hypothetical protein